MTLIVLQRLANHRNFYDLLSSFDTLLCLNAIMADVVLTLLYLNAIMAGAVLIDDLLIFRHRHVRNLNLRHFDNLLNVTVAAAVLIDDLRHVCNLSLRPDLSTLGTIIANWRLASCIAARA